MFRSSQMTIRVTRNSTVFKFIKEVELTVLGETELVETYVKEYIEDRRTHEIICVISFHEEGLHD